MSVIFAGDRSGTGKTTLTLALLAALTQKGQSVQSFKVGPDYIDPMFHAKVTGRPCYNLDPVLTNESYVQQSFCSHCAGADYAVIEGVMGLFDGATGVDDTASTAHVARLLNLPVVLIVDCGRMSRSLAALVQGYRDFDKRVNIAGVVLNRVGSDRHLQLLTHAINAIKVPILGVFRREKDIQLPDRHLGLVPADELEAFEETTDKLADIGERCFDWSLLDSLLRSQKAVEKRTVEKEKKVRIAIAQDSAFNFYYPDNFEILEEEGAELVFWSPIKDEALPAAEGLYFGGGFPEVFAEALSSNRGVMISVKKAINAGIPTYAECGGLMYLSETLVDFDGQHWPMVGSIPQTVAMGGKLSLGYRSADALQNSPLVEQNNTVVGHEFHRSSVVEALGRPMYRTRRFWGDESRKMHEGYGQKNLHASYVHLHFGRERAIAQRFIQSCIDFKNR